MKRVLVLLLLFVAMFGWSQTITFMHNGYTKFAEGEEKVRGYSGAIEKIVAEFQKDHPGVKVNVIVRDVSKGSQTFDALLAAGKPPDIWLDASGYFPKYMNADYALPLEKYMDLKNFMPELLNLYKVNGHQYAVPMSNIATGMAVNLDMLKKIGYTLPAQEKWTTDEFLSLSAKLKAAGIPATMIMAKGGVNSWTNIWFRAFGGTMFKPGDFSKVAVNTPETLKGLEYIKTIIDNGYCPDPIEHNDDDGVELFTTGKVFSCMMQNGHTDYWVPEQVKQGKLDKAFEMTFVEFPHAPNLKHTPVSGYQTCVMAKASKDEKKNKLVGELVARLSGYEAQWYSCTLSGGFPTLMDFVPSIGMAGKDSYKAIAALASTAGVYKEYPDGEKGTEVRRIWYALSEQWIRGKMDAKAFLSQFEKEANAVLAK